MVFSLNDRKVGKVFFTCYGGRKHINIIGMKNKKNMLLFIK